MRASGFRLPASAPRPASFGLRLAACGLRRAAAAGAVAFLCAASSAMAQGAPALDAPKEQTEQPPLNLDQLEAESQRSAGNAPDSHGHPPPDEPKLSWSERAQAAVRRLWRKPDPEVESGNTKVRRGDPKSALELYEKAGERLSDPRDQAALAFDRSTAFIAEGKSSAAQAADEARRALESVHGELHAPAAYNLGFALADANKKEEAVEAYGRALKLNPDDADARYNLELLLRDEQKPQGGQGQEQKDKPGQQDEKKDQQQSKGNDSQQQKDKSEDKKDPGQQAGKGQDKKDDEQKQQPKPEEGKDQKDQQAQGKPQPDKGTAPEKKEQQAQAKPVDRSEGQRLLDAVRANEKNLQVWRFGQRRTQPQRTRDAAKDW